MVSPAVPAKAVAGHNSIPTANERNTKDARARERKDLIDILYPGASTSRLKRYAAEPAPDLANLPLIDERTANRRGIRLTIRFQAAGTDRPAVRRFRSGSPDRPRRNCQAAPYPPCGTCQRAYPR